MTDPHGMIRAKRAQRVLVQFSAVVLLLLAAAFLASSDRGPRTPADAPTRPGVTTTSGGGRWGP